MLLSEERQVQATISREFAEDMMAGILEANEILHVALREASRSLPSPAADHLRTQIAKVLGRHLVHVMNPIGAIYPDLYPDALRAEEQCK